MRRRPLLLLPLAIAGCVAPSRQPPAPPVRPVSPPPARPLPPPARVPTPSAELPAPAYTPGSWRYAEGAATTAARFGPVGDAPLLVLSCVRTEGRVRLTVPGTTGPLTLRATTLQRTVAAEAGTAEFGARDPLLDALAFSRGRFTVTAGARTLVIPPWPEFARVVEDCRAPRTGP